MVLLKSVKRSLSIPLETSLYSSPCRKPLALLQLNIIVIFLFPNLAQGPTAAVSVGALHAVPKSSVRLYPGAGSHDSPGGGSV